MSLATRSPQDADRLMRDLVLTALADRALGPLRPDPSVPADTAGRAQWRLAWVAWQHTRGFEADLIAPPHHYRPNPYWGPAMIRLWAYNRAALLLTEAHADADADAEDAAHHHECTTLMRFLGVVPARLTS